MFRFTIRDLLWLMVVVGLAVGLFAERRRHSATYHTAVVLQSMFDTLATQTVNAGRWRIRTTPTTIEIVLPPYENNQAGSSLQVNNRLTSLEKEWSPRTILAQQLEQELGVSLEQARAGITDFKARPDDLVKLLQERYEAAKAEFYDRKPVYLGGRMSYDDVLDCVERFARAAVQSGEIPEERVKECELALAEAKDLQKVINDKFKNEVEPLRSVERARHTVAEVEILLYFARKEAKESASHD